MSGAQGQDKVQAPGELDVISQLLRMMGGGGQTETTNPGDISALQQLFAQLQGANYQGLLQSIFQQAGGQIPGIQAAMSNAMGARSGNNSAVAAALQELLKATTIEAQGQLVSQQLNNQQIQQNAAANMAQATRGTQSVAKPQTLTGSGLGDLAALFAVLKGAQTITGSSSIRDMGNKMLGGTPAQTTMAPVRDAVVQNVGGGNVTSAPVPMFSLSAGNSGLSFGGVSSPTMIGSDSGGGNVNNNQFSFTDFVPNYNFAPTNFSNVGLQAPALPPVFNPSGGVNYGLSSGSSGLGFRAPMDTSSYFNW
jgi:hypothetical protein